MKEVFSQNPVYFLMATLGSGLFLIKLILLFVAGDGDVGDDADIDIDHADGGDTFSLVSIQSILAFFMGAGWAGLAAVREWQIDPKFAVATSAGFGFTMMILSAFLTFKIKSLNYTPKSNIKDAVGKMGRAYSHIPEKGSGIGQVEITVNGKQQILQAMSSGEKIQSFAAVKVESVDDSGNLIVTLA